MSSRSQALVDSVWPSETALDPVRFVTLLVAGSLLLAISARINVPMWPVPMTMQTFAVLLIGLAYGARLGTATLVAYLVQGAAGLPVFAGGAGLAYLGGPTGGYLMGFVVAAALCGHAADRGWDRHLAGVVAAVTAGTLVIFACGVAWLAVIMGGLGPALGAGLVPFIPGAIVKGALVAALLPAAWWLLGRRG